MTARRRAARHISWGIAALGLLAAACGGSVAASHQSDAGPASGGSATGGSGSGISGAGGSAGGSTGIGIGGSAGTCAGTVTPHGCVVTLASGLHYPTSIVVDAKNVYFVNGSKQNAGASVMKVPIAGGAATVLAQRRAGALAIDGQYIYWGEDTSTAGSVVKMPLTGGVPITLASSQSVTGLAIDSKNAYWTDLRAGTVLKAPLSGGTPIVLASGQDLPSGIAVDAKYVYWTDNGKTTGPGPDASGPTFGTGSVMRVPLGGGTPVKLASTQVNPSSVAVDATGAYWTNDGVGLMRAPLAGGPVETLVSGNVERALALDATHAYFSLVGGLDRVALQSGVQTPVADTTYSISSIAVDSTTVYWTEYFDGVVMKQTPK